jgi:hypothetical protein
MANGYLDDGLVEEIPDGWTADDINAADQARIDAARAERGTDLNRDETREPEEVTALRDRAVAAGDRPFEVVSPGVDVAPPDTVAPLESSSERANRDAAEAGLNPPPADQPAGDDDSVPAADPTGEKPAEAAAEDQDGEPPVPAPEPAPAAAPAKAVKAKATTRRATTGGN